jgi:carbonic anhydrase/acetyltransferase-like protein (isoleucine patch superfamily)
MAGPWIHETAVVLGQVELAEDASVWPTAVIRGDVERIVVGARSNVQDGAVIHADPGMPTIIGADCVIGHRAIVHGAVLEDGVLVGMGAIVLNGARIGSGSLIGAGAVVTEGTVVPDAGARDVIRANAARYVALAGRYARGEIDRQR